MIYCKIVTEIREIRGNDNVLIISIIQDKNKLMSSFIIIITFGLKILTFSVDTRPTLMEN